MGYKFYYFNARGRGETIRLIFVAAGQDFEDVRFTREEWPQHKPKSPTGQAPFLETPEGTILVQSRAIQRYLANKFGLYGANAEEKYKIDVVSETIGDIQGELMKMYFAENEEAKMKLAQAFFSGKGLDLFKTLSQFLSEGQPGAVVGAKTSWVDLELLALTDFFYNKPETTAFLEKFPVVVSHAKVVKALPKVAAYLATRPVTEM